MKKNFDPSPRGVPLDLLQKLLSATDLKVSRGTESLTVKHKGSVTKLQVFAPNGDKTSKDAIQSVIQVTTDLPENLPSSFFTPQSLKILNQAALLGAITLENGRCFIGSRLTVLEQKQNWDLYIPFLLFTLISGSECHLGAILITMGTGTANMGESDWTEHDFQFVQSELSKDCVCTVGDLGLTAEFGLRAGATSAAFGHHQTALWQLSAKDPHPENGGGYFARLQMPHRVAPDRLPDILQDLNRREMSFTDQPPHFGAWCEGHSESTLAYASFLPNLLHRTETVALDVSIWAFQSRANGQRLSGFDQS